MVPLYPSLWNPILHGPYLSVMGNILIPWNDGAGHIVVSSTGGDVYISSDTANEGIERRQMLTFRTLTGNATAEIEVIQKGMRVILRDNAGRILRSNQNEILTAKR